MKILFDPATHLISLDTHEERQTARKDAWLRHMRDFPKATLVEADAHLFRAVRP